MVHWTIYFKFSFPTVTNKVYKGPVPVIENSWLHHELSESDLPQRHPVAVAQFLQYLLDNHLVPEYYFDPVVNIVKKLQPFAEARGDLLQVCHRLAELGYAGAAALRDSITTSINQLALLHLP